MHTSTLPAVRVPAPAVPATTYPWPVPPQTLEEFRAWRSARDAAIQKQCSDYSRWAAEHNRKRPAEDSPDMPAWRAEAQAAHDEQVRLSDTDDGSSAIFAYWSKVEYQQFMRTTRFFSCSEERGARTWPWNSDEPTATEVARVILEPLATEEYRVVFDPDSRTWLRFDPAAGYFSKIPGTAEQAARVLVTEAAECTRQAYLKFSEYEQLRWSLPPEQRLAIHTGRHWGYARFWQIASGKWHDEDGYGPSVVQIAQALVDLAGSGELAKQTRKGIKAGESGRGLFLPWRLMEDPAGEWWSSEGYEGVYDFGGDPLLDEMNYREVPFKAANYIPGPDMPIPGFEKLCELVWPDELVRDAALRTMGMAFTGIPTKEVIFWRGETSRGKSLMAALFSNLLGGYARNVPAKLLFGYAADDQRAAQELVGTWLAVIEEGMGNQSFKANEAFKAMSNGGALLNARQLYHESRMITATHTLLLCANPEADPDFRDDAILERLIPIAFTGHAEKIREYAKTYNPSTEAWKREAPGVLAKMLGYAQEFLDGWRPKTLLDLKKAGLLPGTIDDDLVLAIEMRTSTNVAPWFADEHSRIKGKEWPARDLYSLYTQWCGAINFGQPGRGEVLTENKWGREMKQIPGVEFRRSNGARYFIAK